MKSFHIFFYTTVIVSIIWLYTFNECPHIRVPFISGAVEDASIDLGRCDFWEQGDNIKCKSQHHKE